MNNTCLYLCIFRRDNQSTDSNTQCLRAATCTLQLHRTGFPAHLRTPDSTCQYTSGTVRYSSHKGKTVCPSFRNFSFCFPLSQHQPAALPAWQLFDPYLPHHSSFFMLKYVAMVHENAFFLKLNHYFNSFTGSNKNSVLPAKLIAAKLP